MDTGLVLQLRDAAAMLHTQLVAVRDAAAELARTHRSALMPGRTHGQHAVPITFGYKMAVWVDELDRQLAGLDRATEQAMVVQFGGACGTLASVGAVGLDVRRELAAELDLDDPAITWHVTRDRLLDLVFQLTSVAIGLKRFSRMVITLGGNETAELAEPFHHGKVGSSTMPHKRNPVLCETIWSAAVLVEDGFRSMMTAAVQEHERDMASWQVEWEALPRLCTNAHHALTLTVEVLEGLTVREARMRTNVDATDGLIMSEALMMRLAPHLGRQDAHDVVYDAAMAAQDGQGSLLDLVQLDERVASLAEATQLVDPAALVDGAEAQVDHVLADQHARP